MSRERLVGYAPKEQGVETDVKIIGIAKSYRHIWPNLQASLRTCPVHSRAVLTFEADALPEPMVFLKAGSSVVSGGAPTLVPRGCEIMEEGVAVVCPLDASIGTADRIVELAVIIGKAGKDVGTKRAMEYVSGYCKFRGQEQDLIPGLAFDLAAYNIQQHAKASGAPWDIAKGLETFTQLGQFIPRDKIKDPLDLHLTYKVRPPGIEEIR